MDRQPVGIHPRLLVSVVEFAAQHSASVEDVVMLALRSYMEDVTLQLLPPPPPAPAYLGRLRRLSSE